LAQLPNLPREFRSTQVLVRFCLRIIILLIFAVFGSIGFGRSLAALLGMSAVLSAVIGANDDRLGVRFPDMTAAYDHRFREMAVGEGNRMGIGMYEGVYAALPGPSYETPAEIRYLRTIGADLVGMSTVPEVIAARHSGIRVLGISCVTNAAAGILDQPLDHKEVLETAERVKGQFIGLLKALIPRIAEAIQ